jgi:zinc transport system permease protein
MSIGVLFMAKTPGYTDPSSYLFGNILLITKMDLLLLAILDLIVLFLAWLFYPQILSASFDESFARVRGVKTELVFFVLLIIIAISVVLLQTFVGLVMVIAMLTLPSGTASYMAKSLSSMMVFASVFSLLFSLSGLALSWTLDLPSGAVTVVFAGFVFLLFTLFHFISKKRRT